VVVCCCSLVGIITATVWALTRVASLRVHPIASRTLVTASNPTRTAEGGVRAVQPSCCRKISLSPLTGRSGAAEGRGRGRIQRQHTNKQQALTPTPTATPTDACVVHCGHACVEPTGNSPDADADAFFGRTDLLQRCVFTNFLRKNATNTTQWAVVNVCWHCGWTDSARWWGGGVEVI